MKKNILYSALALSSVLASSCVSKDLYEPDFESDKEEVMLVGNAFERIYVEVPEGKVAIVANNGEIVAFVKRSQEIFVPASLQKTRADGWDITYADASEYIGVDEENVLMQTIAFEDSKMGDFDYNDLVLHVKMTISADGTKFIINPVALGAMYQSGFGISIDGEDYDLSDNTRQDFFQGDQGFINTEGSIKIYPLHELTLNVKPTNFAWYIKVNGEKIYAANKDYVCKKAGLGNYPYGLVLANVHGYTHSMYEWEDMNGITYHASGNEWWNFPRERAKITDVYPDFDKAFMADGNFLALGTPAGSEYMNVVPAPGVIIEPCIYARSATAPIIVAPQNEQIITWEQDFSEVKVGTTLSLSAQSSSGLGVTYTVLEGQDKCNLVGNTISFSERGKVVIRATQNGNYSYKSAIPVDCTINVQSQISISDDISDKPMLSPKQR